MFQKLSVQIDRNLNFDEQLNKTSKKMICVLRSIYLIRNQIPLNQLDACILLRSLALAHFPFLAIILQNLSAKNLKLFVRQINWSIKVIFLPERYDEAKYLIIQTKIIPAKLIMAKMSLIKFYDIARQENSESFHGYLSPQQNTRKKFQSYTACQSQCYLDQSCA